MQRTWRLAVLLVLFGLVGATRADAQTPVPPPSAEGPAIAQVRAGDALLSQGQYREAAAQYEAAYAIDPALPILERLADAYRLAGDTERAMVLYQRIAAAKGQQAVPPPPPPPPQPTYVAPSALPPPAPAYTYTRTSPQRRAGSQLLNAGAGLLIAGYGVALVGGAITMGATYATSGDSSWYGAGGMLMIPIAGPFATNAFRQSESYWVYWAAGWGVISGGMQLTGLALLIAGAAVRANSKPTVRAEAPAKKASDFSWTLAPYNTSQGGGLVLSGRF